MQRGIGAGTQRMEKRQACTCNCQRTLSMAGIALLTIPKALPPSGMLVGKHSNSPYLARSSSAQSPQPPQKKTTSQAQETQVPGHSPLATPTHASSKSLLWRDFASHPDTPPLTSPNTWLALLPSTPASTSPAAKGRLRAQALHLHAPQLCLPSTAPSALSSLPNTPICTSHHQHNTTTNTPT